MDGGKGGDAREMLPRHVIAPAFQVYSVPERPFSVSRTNSRPTSLLLPLSVDDACGPSRSLLARPVVVTGRARRLDDLGVLPQR
jgi:hypothetical protein